MKVLNRAAFLAMPPGTLYQKYRPYTDDLGPCIKHQTTGDDWIYTDLAGIMSIECGGSDDMMRRLDAMKDKGASFPNCIEDNASRDGTYETSEEMYFLVYETMDVYRIIQALSGLIQWTTVTAGLATVPPPRPSPPTAPHSPEPATPSTAP